MIPVRAEGEAVIGGLGDVSGEMYVLSCAQAACGARLTVAARTRGEFVPPGIAPTCRYQPYAVFPVHELAALCARLNVTGHGITAPPARALPEPWLSLLTHYRRRKPRTTPDGDGCAALAAAFPDLDGIRLALLGLHHSRDVTELFAQAGGLPPDTYEGRLGVEPDLPLRIWIRDSGGRWHATCARGWSGVVDHGEVTMRLQVLPPLSRAAAWIDVLASGQSAEVHVTLPLRWQ